MLVFLLCEMEIIVDAEEVAELNLQCTYIPFPACGDSAFCKETENIHNTTHPTPHALMPHSTSTICTLMLLLIAHT